MRIREYIVIVALLLTLPLYGGAQVGASPEQEEQFMYYWYAAQEAIQNEQYPEAYVLLQFCDELKPNDVQTLYYLGVMHEALKHEQEAKECFERAYQLAGKGKMPEDLPERLKMIYIDEKQWDKAIKMQDAIDKINGYDAYSAITRYRIYAMANQPKKAIQAVDDYLKVDPDNIRFLLFRIDLTEQTNGKKKTLYALYERVLELDPYNMSVLNNYAYHLATHGGDLTKAEQMSAITIREEPNNPTCLDTYGWIMHLKGQDELAKFYLNKALWNAKSEENILVIRKHLEAIK